MRTIMLHSLLADSVPKLGCCRWDILALATIDYVFYNSLWYVISLMAAEQLALRKDDATVVSQPSVANTRNPTDN